ncbi:MAG: 3-isopropylmalate dehydrogenase [Dehalococcoidia bacterium]|nr:3-isopropylmalate dehydrogenase [Dehalococcoidia bacterium]
MKGRVAVGPGDGIGPEVVEEGVKVLKAAAKKYGHQFELEYFDIGGISIDKYGTDLTPESLELCRKSDAILFGAAGGPKWDIPGVAKYYANRCVLTIRQEFGLWANIRPVKVYPGMENCSPLKPGLVKGVDLIVLRENTGGAYFGQPKKQWQEDGERKAVDSMVYAEHEIVRIVTMGFELARQRKQKLASIEKANVTETGKLWRKIATELSEKYPDVAIEHMYADAATMWLMREPARFDVMVMGNLYGDILSDQASTVSGSLGMGGSAQLAGLPQPDQRVFGFYESAHGSAPDIAGKGIANPIATILSVAYMLHYTFGLAKEAAAIDSAVATAVKKYRTGDVMEDGLTKVGTQQMGDLIAAAVAA